MPSYSDSMAQLWIGTKYNCVDLLTKILLGILKMDIVDAIIFSAYP